MSGVCAVVVTFNRKMLLRECLRALERQTRKPDGILLVNNHSTDGTEAMLAAEFGHLPCLNLTANRGGAGGFYEGMKWAFEAGYDWIWIMDDDIEPYPETLARMLEYGGESKFIHMRRDRADGSGPLSIEAVWDVSACVALQYGRDISFEEGGLDKMTAPYGNFEGALIHRSVIEKIGYPDERFFVGGDDLIYGYLASFHTNVLHLRESGFRRALPQAARWGRMSYYLSIRNRFLLREHLEGRGVRVNRKAFWAHLLTEMLWMVRDAMRGFPKGWQANARAPIEGLLDGAKGRFGRPPWIPA